MLAMLPDWIALVPKPCADMMYGVLQELFNFELVVDLRRDYRLMLLCYSECCKGVMCVAWSSLKTEACPSFTLNFDFSYAIESIIKSITLVLSASATICHPEIHVLGKVNIGMPFESNINA